MDVLATPTDPAEKRRQRLKIVCPALFVFFMACAIIALVFMLSSGGSDSQPIGPTGVTISTAAPINYYVAYHNSDSTSEYGPRPELRDQVSVNVSNDSASDEIVGFALRPDDEYFHASVVTGSWRSFYRLELQQPGTYTVTIAHDGPEEIHLMREASMGGILIPFAVMAVCMTLAMFSLMPLFASRNTRPGNRQALQA